MIMFRILKKYGIIAILSMVVSIASSLYVDYLKNYVQNTNEKIQKLDDQYIELAKEISLANFLGNSGREKMNETRDALVKQVSATFFLATDLKGFVCKDDVLEIDYFINALDAYRKALVEVFGRNDISLSKDSAFELTRRRHMLNLSLQKYKRWPFYRCWIAAHLPFKD